MITEHEFKKQFELFKKHDKRFSVKEKDIWKILNENTNTTKFDKHYISWAARKLNELKPKKHVDISSMLYFSTLISAFIPIDFYDYRPASITLNNLRCEHANLTALPFNDNSINSISCMHVIEHIGLGRYGDDLDVNGDLKAINELKRIINRNGYLLFVVPIGGIPKIQFNAHRIYSYQQIMRLFDNFSLEEFSLIPTKTQEGIIINATEQQANKEQYGCGCFLFKKRK